MPRINSYDLDYSSKMLFAEEAEKTEQEQLYHLITLELPDDPLTIGNDPGKLNIVDANHDVVLGWNGIHEENKGEFTWTKFPVKYSPAEVNADGSIAKASITIANVSREIMYYVEEYNGLKGCRVHIRVAYAGVLYYTYRYQPNGTIIEEVNSGHNPDAIIHDEYFIDNYTANETTVKFQLDPIIDLEIRMPRRRYMVDSCYWTYRDPDTCGFWSISEIRCAAYITAGSNILTFGSGADGLVWVTVPTAVGSQYRFAGTDDTPDLTSPVMTVVAYNHSQATVTLSSTAPVSRSGYIIPLEDPGPCNKTLAACKLRNNQRYFGGFPGISGSRRILL